MPDEIKKSGDKYEVKRTPSNIENRLNNVRPQPSNTTRNQGTQNPPHWHIPIPAPKKENGRGLCAFLAWVCILIVAAFAGYVLVQAAFGPL